MPHLSIIVPCKNEEKDLPKLLASIKKQTFTDYEIIVADAPTTTDRTREIAEAGGARVVEGGMPGPGRNRGAAVAKGKILLFLDADVVLISKRYLEDVLKEFEELKADMATCYVVPDSPLAVDRALHHVYNVFIKLTERVHPHVPGFCILVRRSVHEGIHGFDEDIPYAEDIDYVLRAVKAGYRFRVLSSQSISVSVRRFEKDGRWNIAMKYMYTKARIIAKGPFRHKMPFRYEMGGAPRQPEDFKK